MYRQKFPARINRERNNAPSMTRPDPNHLSIRDILNFHTRGMSVNGFTPLYDATEEVLEDIRAYDLTEIQQMRDTAMKQVADFQKLQKLDEDKQKEAQRRAYYKKLFSEEQAVVEPEKS